MVLKEKITLGKARAYHQVLNSFQDEDPFTNFELVTKDGSPHPDSDRLIAAIEAADVSKKIIKEILG